MTPSASGGAAANTMLGHGRHGVRQFQGNPLDRRDDRWINHHFQPIGMHLDEGFALGALEIDELALGRSPEFWWLRPGARGKAAAGLVLLSGLTAARQQMGLARLLIDK